MKKLILIIVLGLGLIGCANVNHSVQELTKTGGKSKICSNKSVKETYNVLLKNIDECYSYKHTGVAYGGYGAYTYSFEKFYEADQSKRTIALGSITSTFGKTYNRYFRVILSKGKCKTEIVTTSKYNTEESDKELVSWLKGKRSQCPAKEKDKY